MRRALVALFAAFTGTASAADLVPLDGHVLPALSGSAIEVVARDKAAIRGDEPVTLTIVLRREHQAAFDAFLAELYDPKSPMFRKYLATVEVSDRYGPSRESYDALRAYFEKQGFVLRESSANRMTLTLTGTRAMAEAALATPIVDYRIGDKAFRANADAPMLPADLAWRVQAVVGLSSLAEPRPHFVEIERRFPTHFQHFPRPPSPDDDPPPDDDCDECRTPDDDCSAYGGCGGGPGGGPGVDSAIRKSAVADARSKAGNPDWSTVTGAGQRIGIVAFDRYDPANVADYFLFVKRPALAASVSRVAVNGGATPGADESEVLLDIVTALMVARGAEVVVYDAPFAGGGTSFQTILNAMIGGGVTVITNSWAYCENQTTPADVQSIDALFATAAASGISAFNASGDAASTCLNGAPGVAHVPATSPHAVAVGGSSLAIGPGNAYVGETWWSGISDTPPTGQGGFGASAFFARPAYQDASIAGPMRSVPDVVANADPLQGTFLCQASRGGCPANLLWGGTSMSAPMWAGFAALLNEAQGANLGHLNPSLYPLAGTLAFHDATSLASDVAHVGLGSPRLNALSLALRGASAGPVSPTASAVSRVGRIEGGVFDLWPYVSADGAGQAIVAVRLRDANGNPIGGKTVTLAASAGSSAIVSPGSAVTSTENGTALFSVTDLVVEDVTFTAIDTTDAVALADTATAKFVVPVAAAASIVATPGSVLNDGVATTSITVTLVDALGRPTPGKLVVLSQGNGRSVVSGPSPSRTDAGGTIVFTATDTHAETVTYTAYDASDRLDVPGSAVVDFTGQPSTGCVTTLPTAAAGYALTPWSNGYPASAFSYSGIDFACGGASNPVFDADGSAYVANFSTGDLFHLPVAGGAATSGFKLATHGPTLAQPVLGKDGRLYAARSATGGGLFSGAIYELDPDDGSIVRTVASPVTCPQALAVDPVSGDLFYNDTCFGAGTDDARIFRIADPAGAATISTYATLPGSPSGYLAFAPDGTLYAQSNYLDPSPKVQRITGTDKPQPATVTQVPGLTSIFWLTIGETLPSGDAKSLVVLQSGGLRLADITTNPPTFSDLTSGGSASGTVGPDGCLYFSAAEVIYRLAKSDGSCGFDAANAVASLLLTPSVVAPGPTQGDTLTFTASFANLGVPAGTPVTLTVIGVNGQLKLETTGAAGTTTFPLRGTFAGDDVVVVSATVDGTKYVSNEVEVSWSAGPHATFLTVALAPAGGSVGATSTLKATLVDVSVVPNVAIAGQAIQFTLGALGCSGVTDGSGTASCDVTPTSSGKATLTASYAGNASYLASSASQSFLALAAPNPACFTGLLPGGGTASACVAGALAGCQFASAAFVAAASVGTPPPAGLSLPFGLFQFVATGCGSAATLTLTYPSALAANTSYWKFGPTAAQAAHWYAMPAQVSGNTLSVTLVDGGAGDSDLAVDGSISDPGGAGVLALVIAETTVPVPALDRAMLVALAALMLLAVVRGRGR